MQTLVAQKPTKITTQNMVIGKEYYFEISNFTHEHSELLYNLYAYRKLTPAEVSHLEAAATIKLVGIMLKKVEVSSGVLMGNVRLAFLEPKKRAFESTILLDAEMIYPNEKFRPSINTRYQYPCLTIFYEYNAKQIESNSQDRLFDKALGIIINRQDLTGQRPIQSDVGSVVSSGWWKKCNEALEKT